MEELAKARWIYEAAEWEWTAPLGLRGQQPRSSKPIDIPAGLRSTRHPHAGKLQVAEQFASGLGGFWDPSRRIEYYSLADLETFEGVARQLNLNKQAGLYVDRAGAVLTSPLDVPEEGVQSDIKRAAKVIQMHLIEDHTRQQDAPDSRLIDSVEDLHWAVMPYSDPELFAEFVGRVGRDVEPAEDGDDG
jgi:hypothetical protein